MVNSYEYDIIRSKNSKMYKSLMRNAKNCIVTSFLSTFVDNKRYVVMVNNRNTKRVRILIGDNRTRLERFLNVHTSITLDNNNLDLTKYISDIFGNI